MAKPGRTLDGPLKALLVSLWLQTYDDIGDEAFYAAFCAVLTESPFFPDISLIRKAAGVSRGVQNPVEREAGDALRKVIQAMRVHTPALAPLPGKILSDSDSEGRALPRTAWRREPEVPAPTFDAITEAAIVEMGIGGRRAGLAALARHPALPANFPKDGGENSTENSFLHRLGKEIEAQWFAAYRDARGREVRR